VHVSGGGLTAVLVARIEGGNMLASLQPPGGGGVDAFPTGDVTVEASVDGASYTPTVPFKIAKK